MKIAIIGVGNMGKSILELLLTYFEEKNQSVDFYLYNRSDLNFLNKNENINCTFYKSVNAALTECEKVFIAIKPQDFTESFILILRENLNPDATIISVMAGIKTQTLKEKLNLSKNIRLMPNLGLNYKSGVTAAYFVGDFLESEKDFYKSVFLNGGELIVLEKEEKIDFITALCGSGPAYFLYFAKIMFELALERGFEKKSADLMIKQTLKTSANILNNVDSFEKLIGKIASKGGTTEAGLNCFEENNFKNLVLDALNKAELKSKNLNPS